MEEVDLIELTRRLLLKAFNNIRQLIIVVIASLVISLLLFYVMPTRYVTNLALSCSIIRIEAVEQIVLNLSATVKDKDHELLAKKLNLDLHEAIKIKEIEFNEVRPSNLNSNSANDLFTVKLTLSDKADLRVLEEAIVKYISDNPNISDASRLYMESFKSNLERVSNEITNLETVRENLIKVQFKTQNFLLMNPSDINNRLVELTAKKNDLNREIALFKSVKIVQNLNDLSKPSFPKLSYFLIGGLVLGFISSIIMLVFKN